MEILTAKSGALVPRWSFVRAIQAASSPWAPSLTSKMHPVVT
jgi:hypothetical protein